jgi:perosamine synthetase
MISISLSPNTEKDDILLAFKLIFQPWRWRDGKEVKLLEEKFAEFIGEKKENVFAFNSGRSCLMAILSSLEKKGEVLLQSFTCNAASNPIIWSKLKPVYVDCKEDSFNIDINDLKRKINSNSRVVMVQHTFGLPAEMDKIVEICHEHNLILIEDCAHSLGAKYKGKKVGTFGDAVFFSFSRDKIISSVYGGMVTIKNKEMMEKVKSFYNKTNFPSKFWILQQLLHPILMNCLIIPTYSFFGKYFLILLQYSHIFSKAVHWKEKRGLKPSYFPKRMPNALAILALNQFGKISRFNRHRKEIANFYRQSFEKEILKKEKFQLPLDSDQVYLRFSLKHPQAHNIIKKSWKENILLGDWYTTPIAPHDTRLEKVGYKKGSCPKAEKLSKQTFNLPTHINISEKKAEKIMDFIKKTVSKGNLK